MADKLRRARDVIKTSLSTYLEKTTSGKYLTYFDGTPTYVTYYQLDSEASREDYSLEAVHSLVGANSPNKYKRIYSLPIWGVDALDVSNELSERGLETIVNGEFLVLPNTVRPAAGDFFAFEYKGMESHIFRVNDVQFDKLSPKKYYRCQYSLYPDNIDNILGNLSGDYESSYDETTGQISVVSSDDASTKQELKNLTDSLIDKFASLFYDEESDTFNVKAKLEPDKTICYWSPYLQKFLFNTKALTKYSGDFMTEYYIGDINERDLEDIYSEEAYRESLFRNIEIQNNELSFDTNFLVISDENLKMKRNLPFFMCSNQFKMITPIRKDNEDDPTTYLNAIPILFSDHTKPFKDVDHYHKVHKMDELHVSRIEPYIKNGDIIYECYRHELEPTKICIALENGTDLEIQDVSITKLINPNFDSSKYNLWFFEIVKKYLNNSLVIDEQLMTEINNMAYKHNLSNYLMMPILIYILKSSI